MKEIPLSVYTKEKGQAVAAENLGVHQTAISAALRKKRNIIVTIKDTGEVSASEIRPFPHKQH